MKPTRFRWVIISLIFAITIVNYVDRASISFAIDAITKEFHLNAIQVGFILGAFGIGYVITTFLGGIAVDRWGASKILLFSALLWSLSIGLIGIANGFAIIFLLRILLGVAEGPNFPAMTRAISDWLPINERNQAFSRALVAVPLALAIGSFVVSELIIHTSWRSMFIILGLLGLAWVPFWLIFFRDFPSQSVHVNEAELNYIHHHEGKEVVKTVDNILEHRKNVKSIWKFLLTNPTFLVNNWAFFVFGYYLFFFMTWLPTYLTNHYHMNLHSVGLFDILPWLTSAIFLWVVGYLSDQIYRRTFNLRLSRSYPILISQLLSAICIIPIIYANNIYLEMIFISLAVGFGMSANANYYSVCVDISKERSGTALGIMDAIFALAGFIAPYLTGLFVEMSGDFRGAFWLLFILALSSVVLVYFFHKPDSSKKFSP